MSWYYWKVLPLGMLYSPTLCQLYVSQPLEFIRKQFPHAYIIYYMNDILLASPSAEELQRIFLNTEIKLKEYGLRIAVDKWQEQEPYTYLGYIFQRNITKPQKIQIRTDSLKTLNDFQKLFRRYKLVTTMFRNSQSFLNTYISNPERRIWFKQTPYTNRIG